MEGLEVVVTNVGLDGAGAHNRGMDTKGCQFHAEHIRDRVNGRLTSSVETAVGSGQVSCDGTNVSNQARALADHVRGDGLGDHQDRGDVGVQQFADGLDLNKVK